MVDKHQLYVEMLQKPRREARFLKAYARGPKLREDFCGTAAILQECLAFSNENKGIGVELDSSIISYATNSIKKCRDHSFDNRYTLINGDSVTVETPGVNIICAANSSIFLLLDRSTLLQYFMRSYNDLDSKGAIVIDVFGGPDAHCDGKDYFYNNDIECIWEQYNFDPLYNTFEASVHFTINGQTELQDAFIYSMRLWSPAELIDAMKEVGFDSCEVLIAESRYVLPDYAITKQEDRAKQGVWEGYIIGYKL